MLHHALRAAAGVKKLSLAFRSSSTSSGTTITIPSDVIAGDLLVLGQTGGESAPTAVNPTGFTQVSNTTNGTTRRSMVSFKIAGASDAGTTITGMNGVDNDNKILAVFSTNGALSGSAFDLEEVTTPNNPAAQTVNAANQPTPLVVIAFMYQASVVGRTFSPSSDGSITLGNAQLFYKMYNTSPADVTVDEGDGGFANVLISFYIRIS
jgi:hypothetical protein